jgi:flagellar biosynthesis protein FliR
VVVWLWEVVLICVRDNSWVVDGLCPRHHVPGGLRFRAIPRWVRAVFAVKQAVKYARLLRPSSAPTMRAIATALGGIFLTARGFASGVLVGNIMHLLLTAAVPTGV